MPDISGLLPAMDAHYLIASLIWGSIGSGIFMYGWKQKSMIPVWTGLLLIGSSYFISSALLMSVAGIAILAGLYWLKKQGY